MQILFATTNQAKIKNYAMKLKEKGYEIVTLKDLNITKDIEETGKTPKENAQIKANFYHEISKLPTIALDDALYLDNVPEELQPKTNVRRVNGKRLTDTEMIDHYTKLVDKYGRDGKLYGYFLKGIAIVTDEHIETFEVKAPRCFSSKASSNITEGYPLAAIQWVESLNKYKSELNKDEEDKLNLTEQQEIIGFLEQNINQLVSQKIDKIKKF